MRTGVCLAIGEFASGVWEGALGVEFIESDNELVGGLGYHRHHTKGDF